MTSPRLAIGPANYAGQAHAWARAVERTLGVPADSFNRGPVRRDEFRFETDREIPAPVFFAPLLREARMRRFLAGYSHLALDGYQTFFQTPRRRDVGADIDFLRGQGLQVCLVAHGTDVRRPGPHQRRNRWSYFNEADERWLAERTAATHRNHRVAAAAGVPLFVSTPDLLLDQPDARWLPVCLDPAGYQASAPVMRRRVPRVVHLPSRRVPPVKGTRYVEPVLRRLHDEGLVEHVVPRRVPHREIPALLASADIVVDQLLAASYGVTAIESMASARVTISAVSPEVAALLPERPPLVHADPDTLERVLRDLVADREGARFIAQQGVDYVRSWHDGRHSANQLAPWLGVEPR